jgi:hypothetical protein
MQFVGFPKNAVVLTNVEVKLVALAAHKNQRITSNGSAQILQLW